MTKMEFMNEVATLIVEKIIVIDNSKLNDWCNNINENSKVSWLFGMGGVKVGVVATYYSKNKHFIF